MSGGADNPHTQEHTMYLPIITPTAQFLQERFFIITEHAITDRIKRDTDENLTPTELCLPAVQDIQTHPHGGTVMVKLDEEHVMDILDGNRHVAWICDLQSTLQSMVDDGTISPSRTWTVTGTYNSTYRFEVEVEALTEEMACEEARDQVECDPAAYAHDDDFSFQDVSAERG